MTEAATRARPIHLHLGEAFRPPWLPVLLTKWNRARRLASDRT